MIGRNWQDTIVVSQGHSYLGATLERVNGAHPELRMTAIDDRWPEERFYFRSDHYNFAGKASRSVFFNGVHPDYHQVTDSPARSTPARNPVFSGCSITSGGDRNASARPQWILRAIVNRDDPVALSP